MQNKKPSGTFSKFYLSMKKMLTFKKDKKHHKVHNKTQHKKHHKVHNKTQHKKHHKVHDKTQHKKHHKKTL